VISDKESLRFLEIGFSLNFSFESEAIEILFGYISAKICVPVKFKNSYQWVYLWNRLCWRLRVSSQFREGSIFDRI